MVVHRACTIHDSKLAREGRDTRKYLGNRKTSSHNNIECTRVRRKLLSVVNERTVSVRPCWNVWVSAVSYMGGTDDSKLERELNKPIGLGRCYWWNGEYLWW